MYNRVEESWSLALISIMITDDTCSIECDARVCFFLISNEAVGIDSVRVCIYLIPFLGNALCFHVYSMPN